jgi:hypothetical protein
MPVVLLIFSNVQNKIQIFGNDNYKTKVQQTVILKHPTVAWKTEVTPGHNINNCNYSGTIILAH